MTEATETILIQAQSPSGQSRDLESDALGRLSVVGPNHTKDASEVKTVRVTNTSANTVATVLTPTASTHIRIIAISIDFNGTTSNGLEVYFGDGTNIGTNAGKEIFEARQAAIGVVYIAFPDGAGPRGGPTEIISMRGTASVAEAVNLIVYYREELLHIG